MNDDEFIGLNPEILEELIDELSDSSPEEIAGWVLSALNKSFYDLQRTSLDENLDPEKRNEIMVNSFILLSGIQGYLGKQIESSTSTSIQLTAAIAAAMEKYVTTCNSVLNENFDFDEMDSKSTINSEGAKKYVN